MVYTDQSTSLLDVMAEKIGSEHVSFGKITPKEDVVVIAVSAWGQEGKDREAMDVDPEDKAILLAAIKEAKALQKRIVVILNVSGPVDMTVPRLCGRGPLWRGHLCRIPLLRI